MPAAPRRGAYLTRLQTASASVPVVVAGFVYFSSPFVRSGLCTGIGREFGKVAKKGLRRMDVGSGPMHNDRGLHGLAVTR